MVVSLETTYQTVFLLDKLRRTSEMPAVSSGCFHAYYTCCVPFLVLLVSCFPSCSLGGLLL